MKKMIIFLLIFVVVLIISTMYIFKKDELKIFSKVHESMQISESGIKGYMSDITVTIKNTPQKRFLRVVTNMNDVYIKDTRDEGMNRFQKIKIEENIYMINEEIYFYDNEENLIDKTNYKSMNPKKIIDSLLDVTEVIEKEKIDETIIYSVKMKKNKIVDLLTFLNIKETEEIIEADIHIEKGTILKKIELNIEQSNIVISYFSINNPYRIILPKK